jgi:DNA processing protein
MTDPDKLEEFLDSNGILRLLSDSPKYPQNMSLARKNRPSIYHLGELYDYSNGISVVGTRSCSKFGEEFAFNLGKLLVDNNHKIISGLADGIDTFAHKGCVDNDGIGIVILAWFHKLYPPHNKPLLDAILENGCAITENPLEPEKNSRFEFLKRDELMVALSDVIVVIESKSKGGAKYTADYAKRKGVPVVIAKTKTDDPKLIDGFKTFVENGAIVAQSENDVIDIIKNIKNKKIQTKPKTMDDFS